jgi:hypothetical protein
MPPRRRVLAGVSVAVLVLGLVITAVLVWVTAHNYNATSTGCWLCRLS